MVAGTSKMECGGCAVSPASSGGSLTHPETLVTGCSRTPRGTPAEFVAHIRDGGNQIVHSSTPPIIGGGSAAAIVPEGGTAQPSGARFALPRDAGRRPALQAVPAVGLGSYTRLLRQRYAAPLARGCAGLKTGGPLAARLSSDPAPRRQFSSAATRTAGTPSEATRSLKGVRCSVMAFSRSAWMASSSGFRSSKRW